MLISAKIKNDVYCVIIASTTILLEIFSSKLVKMYSSLSIMSCLICRVEAHKTFKNRGNSLLSEAL